jgi:hypothetical protein
MNEDAVKPLVLRQEPRPCRAKKPRDLDESDIELLCRMLVDLNLKERKT